MRTQILSNRQLPSGTIDGQVFAETFIKACYQVIALISLVDQQIEDVGVTYMIQPAMLKWWLSSLPPIFSKAMEVSHQSLLKLRTYRKISNDPISGVSEALDYLLSFSQVISKWKSTAMRLLGDNFECALPQLEYIDSISQECLTIFKDINAIGDRFNLRVINANICILPESMADIPTV